MLVLVGATAQAQVPPPGPPDLDNGNILIQTIIPTIIPVLLNPVTGVTPGDATLVLRTTTLVTQASFDAIAPYHPTAVGVSSRLGRRPASEGVTNRNKNIAIAYATYRVCLSLYPKQAATWRSMMVLAGQNPDDASTNPTTAIGIGNLAGTAEEASRFFQMMLNGGKWGRRRICSERTVARAVQEFGNRTLDRTLFIPMRFSAGLMLGDEPFGVWGPNTRQAFGHVGLINKFAWADPQRDLSAAVLTSGIPVIAHHIPALLNVMRGIANTIPLREDPTPFALRLA